MRFIDEVYELYKGHFNGDEEDITAVVVGVLHEQDRDALLGLAEEMDEEELFHMMATYMIEVMKRKVAMEDEQFPAVNLH
ncbi:MULTISPECIES: DUF6154 family protein [Brevibacillus]|jgi:hypothetical protein|uniref:Cytosolic protein n=1 Tax=Brevibacillus parabrevis TaxID=54914 RepID=A0A4Y3PGQ5_BREPA|nr:MULTISPECIES: DUF6154 family protein [Brevibacillus]TGV30377.1 hypothetical protein EN829_037120 [Mesorhizobium sp. M00.F.Ca.ET.186.01.1.1]MBU8714005.1 hypothetical protein [Brevibacillus parabrevis]MDH6350527.1 hypothetical protein [Brevibacillus sp. 1238]MDR4998418.1 DUF6154 family protein [Brevibacillus parabrevis]MED1722983.1 DUF6154 family protein [Brevibacillus parabrevis]